MNKSLRIWWEAQKSLFFPEDRQFLQEFLESETKEVKIFYSTEFDPDGEWIVACANSFGDDLWLNTFTKKEYAVEFCDKMELIVLGETNV